MQGSAALSFPKTDYTAYLSKLPCLNERSITEPPNPAFTVCSCAALLSELIMQHLHEEKSDLDAS